MDTLPKLVKPYYTIEESFHRLKLAGAYLDKSDDVLMLGQNNLIEISLLCDEPINLVKVERVKPIKSTGKEIFNRDKEDYRNYNCSIEDFEKYMRDIEHAEWLIPNNEIVSNLVEKFGSIDITDLSGSHIKGPLKVINSGFEQVDELNPSITIDIGDEELTPFFFRNGRLEPFLIKPLNIGSSWEWHNDKLIYKKSHWLSMGLDHLTHRFESLVVAEIEGEQYFLYKDMESNPLHNRVRVNLADHDIKIKPTFSLDREFLKGLIKKEKFVISKLAIQLFEQKYLSINHNVEIDALPAYLDKNNPDCYALELDIAIQAHNAIFRDKIGNQHQSDGLRIESWLMKNFPEIKSENCIKRIKTVALPKKKVSK